MKRLLILIVMLVLLAAMPFGSLADEHEVVIDFYFPTAVDGPIAETMQRYADAFMADNPGIIVNPIYTGDYNQTRDVILAEGDDLIVDVAVMLAIDLFSFIEEGVLVPAQNFIDEMEDGDAYVEDFFPAMLLNNVDADGVIWSIPFQRSTPVLFYNVDMLAEAGYDEPPRNNEELLEMAQALTTDNRWGLMVPVAGVFPSWMFQSFAAAYGQPLVEEDPTEVYFYTPESLAAVEFVTRLGTDYGVGPAGGSAWGDTPTAFTAGEAAMIYHTTGSLTSILDNADFEVGAAFLPSGPPGPDGTGYGTPMGGGNLYIFDDGSKSEAELQAAWEWVLYLSSPEIQADWGAVGGYIAARQSSWELEPLASLVEEHPQYLVARDQLEIAAKEFSAYRTIDLQNIINTTLSRIISGEVPLEDAADVMAQAQAQIDGLLEEYR
jgi:sn-glycerol 3-phosphate transport system substrate-binding protein